MRPASLLVAFLMISCTEASDNMNICYILDGILIFYGIILTALYCSLRFRPGNQSPARHPEKSLYDGGVYAGLNPHPVGTYETIGINKKPTV
ncbi:Fc receptor, IgE, high affinity I, gamma polypeptide like [Thalassophryne amazonica]|uniref:Fc receptor, IgE, high affinity I, gamma polypeptide like n=1 Tax=Thalassophryne amazonica TaxID=390379 RepID=UPI0014709E1D|nr:Fc receptor, IgE, high affinity I, gamma polypeptide like [Thalassophryne amazonica]